jgi:hypothetical protein
MDEPMTTLLHRRYTNAQLNDLISTSPLEPVSLTDDHRLSLAARFRAVAGTEHRRLDAWTSPGPASAVDVNLRCRA